MEYKSYNIASFKDIANLITTENAERLIKDVSKWLLFYAEAIDHVRKNHPKETVGKTNFEIFEPTMEWVDDGKNDFLGIEIIKK
jgi:hypothetical protein